MTKFVNPYNFIPFEDNSPTTKIREDQYDKEDNLLSGWLDMALYMKTPLIIPNGAYPIYINPENNKVVINPTESQKRKLHKKYSFMKYGDSYVVPGSELRGMTRSVYEAVTNSCVHALMDDKPISQRVPTDSAINKRGLLAFENGKWVLYNAKKFLVKEFKPRDKKEAEKFKGEIVKWPNLPATKYPDGTYLQYNVPVAINPPSEKNPKGQPYYIFKLRALELVHTWDAGDDTPYREFKSALKRDGVGNKDDLKRKCLKALYNAKKTVERCNDLKNLDDCGLNILLSVIKELEKKYKPIKDESSIAYYRNCIQKILEGVEKHKTQSREKNQYKNQLMQALQTAKEIQCREALLKALEEVKRGENQKVPVYYFAVKRGNETLIYMSGSSIGRIGHHRKWKDVLEGHTPCDGPNYCPACLLFGSIKESGLKGRVRFSDAYNTDQSISGEYHTIGILGEPRSSAFEFYYRKPSDNALFWNLDFWSYKNNEGDIEFHDLEHATPRGRKMYWHSYPIKDDEKKTNLNSTMECLQGDAPFRFKVFFDGITKEQLKDLEWVIALGENISESTVQHKLGHAKPLGYGSVKLIIEKENIRTFLDDGDSIRYAITENNLPDKFEPASIKKDMPSVKSVLTMTNTEIAKNKFVAYPHSVKNKEATIFNWFSYNRKNLKNLVVLPEPKDKSSIELEGSWIKSPRSFIDTAELKDGKPKGEDKSISKSSGQSVIFKEGNIFEVEIIDFNPSGYFAQFRIGGTKKESVHIRKLGYKNPEDAKKKLLYQTIKIKYIGIEKGRDGKEYHKWSKA